MKGEVYTLLTCPLSRVLEVERGCEERLVELAEDRPDDLEAEDREADDAYLL